jgi:hypothetical protein
MKGSGKRQLNLGRGSEGMFFPNFLALRKKILTSRPNLFNF